jgi:methylated-DNA-[protein]-cysteine S-methyltransferase
VGSKPSHTAQRFLNKRSLSDNESPFVFNGFTHRNGPIEVCVHLQKTTVETAVGTLHPLVGPKGLCALFWGDRSSRTEAHLSRHIGEWVAEPVDHIPEITPHLNAYFDGDLQALERIPIDPYGTAFQLRVWTALRNIPIGHTCSYRQLAASIGSPNAYRAVAQANAYNPIPLIVPCHRVISSNGGIGGFSCGIERKYWLLEHEGSWPRSSR